MAKTHIGIQLFSLKEFLRTAEEIRSSFEKVAAIGYRAVQISGYATGSVDPKTLPRGTAYISDVGMCGDFSSVLGMDKEEPLTRFLTKIPGGRFAPALGEATMCGVAIDINDATGLARAIAPLRNTAEDRL